MPLVLLGPWQPCPWSVQKRVRLAHQELAMPCPRGLLPRPDDHQGAELQASTETREPRLLLLHAPADHSCDAPRHRQKPRRGCRQRPAKVTFVRVLNRRAGWRTDLNRPAGLRNGLQTAKTPASRDFACDVHPRACDALIVSNVPGSCALPCAEDTHVRCSFRIHSSTLSMMFSVCEFSLSCHSAKASSESQQLSIHR